MVAPLSPASGSQVHIADLFRLREHCRKLHQALEVERAKTSKLRNFISRLNNARIRPVPAAPEQSEKSLQALVQDQTRLIEQLYAENQQYQGNIKDLTGRNQQLMTANDKLKARNIDLRWRLRRPLEGTAAATGLKAKPAQPR